MEVTLISHASVLVHCGDVTIWTDPWLESRAFNNSWAMVPEPSSDRRFLDDVTHIWMSHEHPDHFNIPTLRALPASVKERAVICYQQRNTTKIFDALRKLGFQHFLALPDRRSVRLGDVEVCCWQASLGDSALIVRQAGDVLLNINDAELDERDCRRIAAQFGRPQVVLNQFSLAGYFGYRDRERHLPRLAQEKLERLVNNHRWLDAELTVPFASFVYFCSEDNAYMNAYANTPKIVAEHMRREQCDAYFMRFGERLPVRQPALSNAKANIEEYERSFEAAFSRVTPSAQIEMARIREAYERFQSSLSLHCPDVLRKLWLGTLTFYVPDLGRALRVSASESRFEEIELDRDSADVVVNSQPLWFAFAFPFGFETLGVSARYSVNRFRHWQAWKRMSILINLDVGLRLSQLGASQTRRFLKERLSSGLIRQLASKQLRRWRLEYSR